MSTTTTALILGPASGTARQAIAYLTPRVLAGSEHAIKGQEYTDYDIHVIVDTYAVIGQQVGIDWFIALAQMSKETGAITSWWSQRPRRNPAGIGVTGQKRPEKPDTGVWQFDEKEGLWREGIAFPSWADHAIPAHLGRLLAYALPAGRGTPAQQALIAKALAYRPLPASYRGVAPLWTGLNSRWAVPGTTYGQEIVKLAEAMRCAT